MGLLNDYLLLLWVLVAILSTGIALCSRFTKLKGIELIGYGAGAGVVVHGLFGLLIAIDADLRRSVGVLSICATALAAGYLIRRRIWRELAGTLSRSLRIALLFWLLFLGTCLALVHVDVRWPAVLADGQFISKKHTLNVKVQYVTTLPADNYIPHVVTEFFLRGISFREHHPIMPANEVSNRTVLMSLVALPFRSVLAWRERGGQTLGKVVYLGKEGPDVERLNDDDSFNQFFIVGTFLNSLMLLGLLVLFSHFELAQSLPVAALLYLTNPYFISQTIFTWPKAMAAFFLLLGWNSVRRAHDPRIVGICAALAYHCHPAALPMAASLGLWYCLRAWRDKTGFRPALHYGLAFVLIVLPWFIWTRIFLQLPDDMFAQHFFREGSPDPLSEPLNFIWMRFFNLMVTIVPISFMIYPFNLETALNYAVRCVPTVVGPFLVVPAMREWATLWKRERMLLLYGVVIPATAILLLFSIPSQPALLGWQPVLGVLLFLGAEGLYRQSSPRAQRWLIGLQLFCNLGVIALQGYRVGVHFS
ncbi:MAG: hypothetical protein M3N12_09930 [Verrucomicrobiota bacterium]|nr:hypothetical protein [Verrucomicrobiota bacterium]